MSKRDDKNFSATTPAKRFMKLAGMTASITSTIAKNSIKGLVGLPKDEAELSRLYAQVGERIVNTLGELKGAAMKVGQIASQFQGVFPKEIAEALAKLQKAAPPMPFEVIEQQIIKDLGKPVSKLFAKIERTPFAAASIGQVHRAQTLQGDDVVIKVQYPGVKACVASDLKHLRMALKIAGLIKIDKKMLDAVFAEIKRSLMLELDYVQEAESTREFRAFHASNPKIIIPRVFTNLSAEHVLTLSYEPGDHIDQVCAPRYSQDTINELGHRVFDTIGEQIFGLHTVHCDPHPGNFAFRPDGTVVIYDFGCVKKITATTADAYRKTTRAAIAHDYAALDRGLFELGARNRHCDKIVDGDFYRPWVELILSCFSDQSYDFGSSLLHEQVLSRARKSLKYWDAFQASPETLLVNRTIGSHYWTMKQLGVSTAFRPTLLRNLEIGQPVTA
jgi:predicted unusual protein kinase regulating ubiquinone biosynthesis (AarF/ABC1/UbiB family)